MRRREQVRSDGEAVLRQGRAEELEINVDQLKEESGQLKLGEHMLMNQLEDAGRVTESLALDKERLNGQVASLTRILAEAMTRNQNLDHQVRALRS